MRRFSLQPYAFFVELLLFAAFVFSEPLGQCSANKGSIVCVTNGGRVVNLTSSGRDHSPTVSDSGLQVAFLRRGQDTCNELWLASVEGIKPLIRPILTGSVAYGNRQMCQLASPKFATPNLVYVLLEDFAGTSSLLITVDTNSSDYHVLAPALQYVPVRCGLYDGSVIVQQRRVTLGGIYYGYYWLYTVQGIEKGLVARNQSELDVFMSNQCGQ